MKVDNDHPFYLQIINSLKQSIADNIYPHGTKIPTELELMKMFNVSRITVRKAVSELVATKILVKRQGKGTFVLPPRIERKIEQILSNGHLKAKSLTLLLQEQGYQVNSEVIHCHKQNADKTQSTALNLRENTPILDIQRIRYVNNIPLLFEDCALPYEQFKFLKDYNLTGSIYDILEKHGYNPERVLGFSIESVCIGLTKAKLLNIHSHDPILLQKIISGLRDGTPVNYSEQFFIGNRYKFKFI